MTLSQLDIIQLLAGYHSLLLCLALAGRVRLRGLMVLTGTFGLHMLTNLGVSAGLLGPALDILREIARLAELGVSDDHALSVVIICVTALMSAMVVRARQHDDRRGALPRLDIEPAVEDSEGTDYQPVFQRINTLLVDEQSWREPRLSLAEIATRLRISQRDASRAINLHSGQSFSRYINRFRIAEVDRLMADPDNHRRTVIELAYEAGFNSKSAFNRIYRDESGRTPTQAFQAHKSC